MKQQNSLTNLIDAIFSSTICGDSSIIVHLSNGDIIINGKIHEQNRNKHPLILDVLNQMQERAVKIENFELAKFVSDKIAEIKTLEDEIDKSITEENWVTCKELKNTIEALYGEVFEFESNQAKRTQLLINKKEAIKKRDFDLVIQIESELANLK